MKNTALLNALQLWRVFILYRVVPRESGKTDKLPTDPLTGNSIDGQDLKNWMLPAEALMWAQQWGVGFGVGLVLTNGLFCIDLDNARDPATGGWYPHVANFEARFPGAYRETSVSNTGRHIMGWYRGEAPAHGTRNKLYRAEAYTGRRFIGLTGDESEGSILTDCTEALGKFLEEFFPTHEEPEHGVEWTSVPVTVWKGPQDDLELIRRATRSVSPKAIFGAGAAFMDLWRADPDILPRAFPSQNNHSPWDGSAADQAFANHLAFYTGNDCERMLKIMRGESTAGTHGLMRAKYERDDYIRGTILNACRTQKEWYVEKAETAPLLDVPDPPTIPDPPSPVVIELQPGKLPPVEDYINVHMLQTLFKDHCYVQDINAIQLPSGIALTKERFDAMLGGPKYALTVDNQKPTKSAWDAFILSEVFKFPRVETQYFKPGDVTGAIRMRDKRREINCYQPVDIPRVVGDPAPFLDLVHRMLPNGNDALILLCYMAACARYIGVKFSWCVFLQGAKGNGKTTVAQVLEYCLSKRYTHWAKADQLGEKFNAVLTDKLLVIVDEMYSGDKRELQEILKQLVTATRIEVRRMYAEKTMMEVCYNMMLISNHQDGVRIDIDERRYAPLFCAQQSKIDRLRDGLDNEYFIKLRRWLWDQNGAAIVYNYLMELEISDEYNPTTKCIVAPPTTSTDIAATASLGTVEQELIEAINQRQEGFRNGWISSQAVDFLLARCGKDKVIPRNARRGLVLALGYLPHPSLPEGRCESPMTDGARPYLYVRRGHAWAVDHLTPDQVRAGFLEAQK